MDYSLPLTWKTGSYITSLEALDVNTTWWCLNFSLPSKVLVLFYPVEGNVEDDGIPKYLNPICQTLHMYLIALSQYYVFSFVPSLITININITSAIFGFQPDLPNPCNAQLLQGWCWRWYHTSGPQPNLSYLAYGLYNTPVSVGRLFYRLIGGLGYKCHICDAWISAWPSKS